MTNPIRNVIGGGQCFFCPGCESVHVINTHPTIKWQYNNNPEKPTFSPSILVTLELPDEKQICHSFVTDGVIQFLGDCTHKLKGQNIPLPSWHMNRIVMVVWRKINFQFYCYYYK